MPTRIISVVTQLHQFIIVFSFKLKTFIGSRAGNLLTNECLQLEGKDDDELVKLRYH
jgi:hypothetical protein